MFRSHAIPAQDDHGESRILAGAPWRISAAAGLGILAAFIAANSTGVLAHSFRHALTLAALFLAAAAAFRRPALEDCVFLVSALAGTLWATSSSYVPVNVMGVAIFLAALASQHAREEETPFLIAAGAAICLALLRFAELSVPAAWLFMDNTGAFVSHVAGKLTGRPLSTGATFAGLDFLVVMAFVYASSLWQFPNSRLKRAWWPPLAILIAHAAYLWVLCCAPDINTMLAEKNPPAVAFGVKPPFIWNEALRPLFPWNVPLVAAVLHAAIGMLMFRAALAAPPAEKPARFSLIFAGIALLLAAGVPALTLMHTTPLKLESKKIVFFKEGFLNWLKPTHAEYGRLSIGMYGMMPQFVKSLGADAVVSPDLSKGDLDGAHLIVMMFPNKPWAPGQLERVHDFVKNGGSLLIMGEHTVKEDDGGNRFNDVLRPTAMKVAFDSATFEIGGWLQSYDALAHPSSLGIRDERNQFGAVIGASVEIKPPARPLLIGRWGYNDPGDDKNDKGAKMGNHQYDGGDRLGDIVLAAEQKLGAGRIVVFGDTSSLTNGIIPGSHNYVSRLYAYLCNTRLPEAQELGALAVCAAIIVLLLLNTSPLTVVACALVFSTISTVLIDHSNRAAQIVPTGEYGQPLNNLAYVDSTHMEAISEESLRFDSPNGLHMTLMRNGYLSLQLPEFTRDYLISRDPSSGKDTPRAGLVVSLAPQRPFTSAERAALREYLECGGLFVCTVGWPESAASREMLADYQLFVGGEAAAKGTGPPPAPMGHFKSPFFPHRDGAYSYVRFHAGWRVDCTAKKPAEASQILPTAPSFEGPVVPPASSATPGMVDDFQPIAYGPPVVRPDGSREYDPLLIILRRIGKGKIVLVGDSLFATNQNLENVNGEPFEGMRENAEFWRWFLTVLREQPMWTPTQYQPAKPPQPAPPTPEEPKP